MSDILVRTPRLCVRRLREEDLEDFQRYRTDTTLARYQGWSVTDNATALAFLREHQNLNWFQNSCWHQIGIANAEQRLIGDIGVHFDDTGKTIELGVTLSQRYHGQGIALEALSALINWLWQNTEAAVIEGITDARNRASVQLLERLGMHAAETTEQVTEQASITEITYRLRRPSP